jgi:maleylacetoacetate isomerase
VKLYTYWRSSTSYRVRIALNLKGLVWEAVPVNLVAGEQNAEAYAALNPGQAVPTLVLDDGTVLIQSMSILEWLDERYPAPPLLPEDPVKRARVRAAALVIAADIHPVNNLKVVAKLRKMGHSQDDVVEWMQDWMARGFHAFAALIGQDTQFCFGDTPGLADLCLVPQLYNAHRWGLELAPFARLVDIEKRCLEISAFDSARPENQPDAA